MICVYKITSPSGKVYIGSTKDYKKRMYSYKSMNCKTQPKLFNSFKKHGVENHLFEIICTPDLQELRYEERRLGRLLDCLGINGLNCKLPTDRDLRTTIYESNRCGFSITISKKASKKLMELCKKLKLSRSKIIEMALQEFHAKNKTV